MDLRKQKTRQAIRRAFLQLRREKALEQITVKELARAAQISKATFYLHYRDIFDLSDQLQQEAIRNVIMRINSPMSVLEDFSCFMRQMTDAIAQEQPLLTILFSGSQAAVFPIHLERQLRNYIFEHTPELKNNETMSVRLTYHIQGSYYAYMEHADKLGNKCVLNLIAQIQKDTPSFKDC